MIRMVLLLTFMIFGAIPALSQEDSTRYIHGLPVSEDDTARQFLRTDLDPANEFIPLSDDKLPRSLVDALEDGDQYQGWQDSIIYFQRNTGLYLVPIRYEEGVKIFGLTEKGDPVTYNEVIVSDGQ